MHIDGLIDAVMEEMERVWPAGLDGTREEYTWLLQHYGITEDDDNKWQDILMVYSEGVTPEDLIHWTPETVEEVAEANAIKHFVTDEQAVSTFLAQLLQKYRSSTAVYEEE